MGLADFTVHELLDHLFGKGSYTPPTSFLALSTTKPTDAGGNLTEPSGNNYSRKTTAAGDWNVAATRKITNANALAFNEASGSWGTLTHFAICDSGTTGGGNVLAWGRLGKAYSTLNEELTAIDTTITVADGTSYPASGTVQIESEDITYTGKSTNDLTGCTRGANSTTAHAHALGKDVFLVVSKAIASGDTPQFAAGDLETKVRASE
jgi:hypothetical protein